MSGENLQILLAEEWIYRGEGNANLVLSLLTNRKILRIPKTDQQNVDESNSDRVENLYLDFYNSVMISLLGKSYTHPALKIVTEREEMKQLNHKLLSLRPENRKVKHLKHGLATLWTDYAFLPKEIENLGSSSATFAVEIKPKQGWCFPKDVKHGKCQFCLHQYLKLQKGQIKQITSYCPMNLFSGVRQRMVAALKALVENPQNNLKIFKNGILLYDENSSRWSFDTLLAECLKTIDYFCDLIYQVLIKNFEGDDYEPCLYCDSFLIQPNEELQDGNCYFESSMLPPGCVLRKILDLQQLYSSSVEEVYACYQKLNRSNCEEWNYVDKILKEVTTEKVCSKCFLVALGSRENLKVLPYLIAAILNDCSLMVTFRKVSKEIPGRNCIKLTGGEIFFVNVGVFDLYPKCLNTIEKHVKRNNEVETAYRNYSEKSTPNK